MNEQEAFKQGAVHGYNAGYGRAGSYVTGEEITLAWDAVVSHGFEENTSTFWISRAWENGYKRGYLLAAEGSPLMAYDLSPWYA
jgi:hypothetical protein